MLSSRQILIYVLTIKVKILMELNTQSNKQMQTQTKQLKNTARQTNS